MISYSCATGASDRINRVKFYVPSSADIRRMSVVEVTESTIYNRGLPAPGGLSDARMGTSSRTILCATCGQDVLNCQGHPGHIELPFPMYHSLFFDIVLKILRCACFMCSRVCLTDDEIASVVSDDVTGKQRLFALYAVAKMRKKCPHCAAPRPNYIRQSMSIRADWGNDVVWESPDEEAYCKQCFTQRDALSILDNMPDEDCVQLGFDPLHSHPRNMIIQTLLVPPPSVRPAIMASEGSKTRGQDDLTSKLQDIMKRSQEVRAAIPKSSTWRNVAWTPDFSERVQRLQYEVLTLVNNAVRGQRPSVQRSGVPTKSYIGRIKGKDGRIRGSLMGKRTDFCARSVISPGPLLDLDQVGVPRSLACTLTVPEIVTEFNLHDLTQRVLIGANDIRGAECVMTSDGVTIHLAQCQARQKIRLLPGWTVERYLQNDDVVAFNRQPSLHKQGLMGHRVKLVNDLTFRMNLSVTAPYNADFDGDEMNLHVPQSVAARASVASLMMVTHQILSPQGNKPCMGIVQDSLVGMYRMSRLSEIFDQRDASHIVSHVRHVSVDVLPSPALWVRGVPYWTGKQLISLIFPGTLNIDRVPADAYSCVDEDVATFDTTLPLVHNGMLLMGRLNKSILGSASGGIVDVVCREECNMRAARVLSDIQRMAIAYNNLRGFSVGISDCVLNGDGLHRVSERIRKATTLAEEISRTVGHDDTTQDDAEVAEQTIRRILSKALMQAGSIVESSFPQSNAIRNMVMSGSKGSIINLSQIGACVGQQSVEGARIFAEKGTRTLPCFAHGERSLDSQGFCESSYTRGLSPYEFFFHAMGGREGLVDTAVKTSETGYIQRRIVKAMESHSMRYDGTVRNAADDIVQFRYAGHGLEPSHLERIKLDILKWTCEKVKAVFVDPADHTRILNTRDEVLRCIVSEGTEVDPRMVSPLNPKRLKYRYCARPSDKALRGKEAARNRISVNAFLACMDGFDQPATRLAMHAEFPTTLLRRCSAADIDDLIAHIRRVVSASSVPAGEMVGCLAAQSVGEPTTQLTLNSASAHAPLAPSLPPFRRQKSRPRNRVLLSSRCLITSPSPLVSTRTAFHFSGVASKNVTLGIPRLKELLTVTKNIKTPTITVRFRGQFTTNETFASYFADTLPMTTLNHVCASCEIVYDPDPRSTLIEDDAWMVESDAIVCPHSVPASYSKYVVRMVLNRPMMQARRITPPSVRRILRQRLHGRAHVISSEVNEVEWVLRIRFFFVDEMIAFAKLPQEREAVLSHRAISKLLKTLVISGHTTTLGASMRSESVHRIQNKDDDAQHSELQLCNEYVVDTNGGDMVDLLAAPFVDWNRCYSNDICEIQNILGISAASEALYQELNEVISFDGTYVFPGHLLIICDTMTRDGFLKPLNRFGVNREHSNALARSSYEETPEVLTEAAIFAENSEARGVSTSIILGQRSDIGTGMTKVNFHARMLPVRMRSSAINASKVVKTTPRAPNTTLKRQHVEFVMEQPLAVEPMQVPYRDEGESSACTTGGTARGDVFMSDECVPPFVTDDDDPHEGRETTSNVEEQHVFHIHTPDMSEDEEAVE